jgi:hypothetical protein
VESIIGNKPSALPFVAKIVPTFTVSINTAKEANETMRQLSAYKE